MARCNDCNVCCWGICCDVYENQILCKECIEKRKRNDQKEENQN